MLESLMVPLLESKNIWHGTPNVPNGNYCRCSRARKIFNGRENSYSQVFILHRSSAGDDIQGPVVPRRLISSPLTAVLKCRETELRFGCSMKHQLHIQIDGSLFILTQCNRRGWY